MSLLSSLLWWGAAEAAGAAADAIEKAEELRGEIAESITEYINGVKVNKEVTKVIGKKDGREYTLVAVDYWKNLDSINEPGYYDRKKAILDREIKELGL